MVERNAGVPEDKRIQFRVVGVHLGDVVEEADGDLMGDGLNIAARLESLAEPGGIALSEDAYRQVKGRLDVAVRDLRAADAEEHRRADPGLCAEGRQAGRTSAAEVVRVANSPLAHRGAVVALPLRLLLVVVRASRGGFYRRAGSSRRRARLRRISPSLSCPSLTFQARCEIRITSATSSLRI